MATKLEMVLEAIDRATGPINKVDDALDKLERNSRGASDRMGRAMRAVGTAAATAAVTGIAALTAAIGGAVNEAIKFEDLWSDANKTLGFTNAQMPAFQQAVNDLSTRVPIAREAIVKMTGDAGRLGIKGKDALVDFVELSAVAAAAFDVDPSRMAQMFGNLRETMGYSTAQLEAWSDKVNWLGNNTAASEAAIAEYASAVQGIAREAGLAEDATLALGAAMIASGRAPEVAVTGLRAFLRTLQKGTGGLSKTQAGYAKLLGIDMDHIQKQMLTDAEGAIRKVSAAISKLAPERRGEVVSALFGEEAGRALGPLLTNAEALEKALARIEQFGGGRTAGAMREEFAAATDDVRDNWAKLKNALSIRAEEVGIPFLAPINDALKSTTALLTTLDQRATILDRITAGLQGFASGLGLTRDAASGLSAILDEAWTSVSQFLFGVADEEASADTIGRIFHDMQTAGERLRGMLDRLANSAFVGQLRTNFASAGEIVADLSATLSNLLGEGSGGRAALDWLAGVSLDAVSATLNLYAEAQGRALGLLRDLSAWFAQASGAIDWNALLPSGGFDTSAFDGFATAIRGILDAVEGFARLAGGTVVEYFTGYFEGLVPYLSSMGDRLSGAWDQIAPILENFGWVGTAIGRMLGLISENEGAMSAVQSFGRVIGSLAGIVGTISLGALEGLLRWVETMTGSLAALFEGDFAGAGEEFKQFFAWLGGLVMPSINLDLSGLQAAFDGMIAIIRSAWATIRGLFDDIISAASGVGTAIAGAFSIGGADAPLADRVMEIATMGELFNNQIDEAVGVAERLRDGTLDAATGAEELQRVYDGLGTSGRWAYGERLSQMIEMLREAANLSGQIEAAAPNVSAPASAPAAAAPGLPNMAALNSSQASVDQLKADAAAAQSAVAALGPKSQAIVATVTSAMAQVEAAANLNLFDKGAAMMDTLAAGMRSRAQAAVQEMQNLAQQLRDHLPSSPAKTGPLSDIHRLKFGETIAGSIHPEPVIKAMRALSAGAMDAARFAPAGLDGRLGLVPGIADHSRSIRLPADENDNGAGFFQRAAASSAGAAPGAPSAGAGPSSGPIDASITIGTVQFGNPDDKAEFEALLRRHSKEIAEIMDYETRRRDRLRF